MGFIMDYIKNDVIEEKRLINGTLSLIIPLISLFSSITSSTLLASE